MVKFKILLLSSFFTILTIGQDIPPQMPDGYYSNLFLKIAYFLGMVDLVDTMPPIPAEIIEYKDLTYKTNNNRDLKLDIYHLKNLNEKRPLLIFIHGGAWKKGNKKDYLKYLIDFALKGYVTATVQYTLSSIEKFPTPVNDIKSAICWLKNNAETYSIDKNKLALIGGSAGGHLAMMVGYSKASNIIEQSCLDNSISSEVNAIVNIYGPSDLTTEYARTHKTVEYFLGKKYEEDESLFEVASPINYLSSDDPPTLIFHGTLDELVPVSQSDTLKKRLDVIGLESEYHRLEGWPHTMDLSTEVNAYCQYYMERFFNKYIPKGY